MLVGVLISQKCSLHVTHLGEINSCESSVNSLRRRMLEPPPVRELSGLLTYEKHRIRVVLLHRLGR